MLLSKKGVFSLGILIVFLILIVVLFIFALKMSIWRVAGILLLVFGGFTLLEVGIKPLHAFILIIIALIFIALPLLGGPFTAPLSIIFQ